MNVIAALGAGARFAPLAWRTAWPALGLACWTFGLWVSAPHDLVLLGLALLAVWAAQGALWRVAFDWILHRRGLHVGQVEWRLAACWLLAGAFATIMLLLVLVALVAAAYAVASSGAGFVPRRPETWRAAVRGPGSVTLGAIGLGAGVALVFAAARLSLAAAATADLGRVRMLSTWARTRGQAARLAVAFTLLGAGPLALLALAWMRPWGAGGTGSALGAGVAGAAALAIWLPLHTGCAAHFWRRLAPGGRPSQRERSAR